MFRVISLIFSIVGFVLAQTDDASSQVPNRWAQFGGYNKIKAGGEMINNAIDMGKSAGKVLTSTVSNVVGRGTNITREGFHRGEEIGKSSIDSVVEATNNALGKINIPGSGIIQAGVTTAGNAGKTVLNAIKYSEDVKLDMIHSAVKAVTSGVDSASDKVSELAKSAVTASTGAMNTVIGKAVDVGANAANTTANLFSWMYGTISSAVPSLTSSAPLGSNVSLPSQTSNVGATVGVAVAAPELNVTVETT